MEESTCYGMEAQHTELCSVGGQSHLGPRGLASPSLGGPLAGPSDPSLLLLGARVAVVWRLGCSPYRGLFRAAACAGR